MDLVNMMKQQMETLEKARKSIDAVKESGTSDISEEDFTVAERYLRVMEKTWGIFLKVAEVEKDLNAKNKKEADKPKEKASTKKAEVPKKVEATKAEAETESDDDNEDDDLSFLD